MHIGNTLVIFMYTYVKANEKKRRNNTFIADGHVTHKKELT